MTARRQEFINNGVSTLAGGISDSVTSLDVATGGAFPAVGNFTLRIDDEILLCTARSSDTLTVVRGVEGSTPASHSNGATVSSTLTVGGINRWKIDDDPFALARPPMTLSKDDGSALAASDFTQVSSFSSASLSDSVNGSILMALSSPTLAAWRLCSRPAPVSTPWEYQFCIQPIWFCPRTSPFVHVGVGLRESGTGKALLAAASNRADSGASTLRIFQSTDLANEGSFSIYDFPAANHGLWFRLGYDGSDCTVSASLDGCEWTLLRQVAVTTPFTSAPDTVVFGLHQNGSSGEPGVKGRLCHWSRTV